MAGKADSLAEDLSRELSDLFKYVERYVPVEYSLESRFQPFIPEYVPSLGQVDDQIKVPRPDGQPDFLGLTCTDEPAVNQSDPALLALRLRHKLRTELGSHITNDREKYHPLGWVEDPEQTPAQLDTWMDSVSALHQGQMDCSSACDFVEIGALLQPWTSDVAQQICNGSHPNPSQSTDLRAFIRTICNVVEIPASLNTIEALHTLFRVYLEFRSNPRMQKHLTYTVRHDDKGAPYRDDAPE